VPDGTSCSGPDLCNPTCQAGTCTDGTSEETCDDIDNDCDGSPLDAEEECDDANDDGTEGCVACAHVAMFLSEDGGFQVDSPSLGVESTDQLVLVFWMGVDGQEKALLRSKVEPDAVTGTIAFGGTSPIGPHGGGIASMRRANQVLVARSRADSGGDGVEAVLRGRVISGLCAPDGDTMDYGSLKLGHPGGPKVDWSPSGVAIEADMGGAGYVLLWTESKGLPGIAHGIYVRKLSAAGVLEGQPYLMDCAESTLVGSPLLTTV